MGCHFHVNFATTDILDIGMTTIIESVDSISRDGPDCPYM